MTAVARRPCQSDRRIGKAQYTRIATSADEARSRRAIALRAAKCIGLEMTVYAVRGVLVLLSRRMTKLNGGESVTWITSLFA